MNSKAKTTSALIAAGAMAAALSMSAPTIAAEEGMEECYGVAKAGANDCKSSIPGSTCQGSSTFDNDPNAWIAVPEGTCEKIVGGSTSPQDA